MLKYNIKQVLNDQNNVIDLYKFNDKDMKKGLMKVYNYCFVDKYLTPDYLDDVDFEEYGYILMVNLGVYTDCVGIKVSIKDLPYNIVKLFLDEKKPFDHWEIYVSLCVSHQDYI